MKDKNYVFASLNYLFNTVIAFLCIAPMLIVIATSFTDETAIKANGYTIFPSVFSTAAYKLIFRNYTQIVNS